MDKKSGIYLIAVCVIILGGVLLFTYANYAGLSNPIKKGPKSNTSENLPVNSTSVGKHYFSNVNETVTVTSR